MRRAAFRRASFRPTLIVLGMAGWAGLIAFTPALWAQPSSLSTVDGMGSYKDPVQRAAGAYSRGLKAKRKAEQEKDLDKRRKLLERAKDELGKSVAYTASYDSLLALGQVELALGNRSAALQSCTPRPELEARRPRGADLPERGQKQDRDRGPSRGDPGRAGGSDGTNRTGGVETAAVGGEGGASAASLWAML